MKSPNTIKREIRSHDRAQRWAMERARGSTTAEGRSHWARKARGHCRAARAQRVALAKVASEAMLGAVVDDY